MSKTILYLSIYVIGIVALCFLIIASFLFFYPIKYKDIIINTSQKYLLEPALVASVINAESGYNEKAISKAGAIGLMQLMPTTAEYIANINNIEYDETKLFEVEYNLTLGCAYLNYLINRFNDVDTAICAYNAGPTKVQEWLNDANFSTNGKTLFSTPYPATNYYLSKIKQNKQIYTKFF